LPLLPALPAAADQDAFTHPDAGHADADSTDAHPDRAGGNADSHSYPRNCHAYADPYADSSPYGYAYPG